MKAEIKNDQPMFSYDFCEGGPLVGEPVDMPSQDGF